MKFGTLHQILNPITVTWQKIEIFKIQDGGGRQLENRFFGHKSSTNCPISAKFCTRKQNGMSTKARWQKLQFFKNPRWRTAAILKIVKLPCLSEKSSDFDEIWYTTSDIKHGCCHVTKYWNFLKFKMAAAAILKFAFLAITRRPIVRFQRNFVWGSRTAGRSTRATWQKLQIFKIQHGRPPPFWKSLNRHIWVKIVRFWWNLVHCIRY